MVAQVDQQDAEPGAVEHRRGKHHDGVAPAAVAAMHDDDRGSGDTAGGGGVPAADRQGRVARRERDVREVSEAVRRGVDHEAVIPVVRREVGGVWVAKSREAQRA